MSSRVRDSLTRTLDLLRHEPTAKRVRAELGGSTVVDTTRAVLLWEPRRVVPTYAVPVDDVTVALRPAAPTDHAAAEGLAYPDVSARPVLDPSVPFAAHTAEGSPVDVGDRRGAGFRLVDPDLAEYVVLDFGAFDAWFEEDRPTVAHPRDPFHRVDVLPSSRHVRLELDGVVLAESTRSVAVFETLLPTRFYLPVDDVQAELVTSTTSTICAYKGTASYRSVMLGDTAVRDLAWTYPEPLIEMEPLRDLIAFFDERIDLVLDGTTRPRPITPWT